MNEKLKAKLDILPLQPGCYIFKDADQNILYVGKAKKLKNRVFQYFNRVYNNKTSKLVQLIDDLEFFDTPHKRHVAERYRNFFILLLMSFLRMININHILRLVKKKILV